MFDINLIKLTFAFHTLSLGFSALLINFVEDYIPTSISKVVRHGKFSSDAKIAVIEKFEVPKSWFRHFYVFAAPFDSMILALLYYRFVFNGRLSDFVTKVLSYCFGVPLEFSVPPENAILAMSLFTIHCWKRFYESHHVNVYSKQYMNVVIYLLGFHHYFGTALSIVGETINLTTDSKVTLNWTKLTWLDYASCFMFLFATYMQFRSNVILANLRKDSNGDIVTKKYKVPHGGLFEYVTAPLQLTEITVYVCLGLILRDASTFPYITIWVIFNQMECAYLSHQWSLKTFKNYPKSRKIIIPFLF